MDFSISKTKFGEKPPFEYPTPLFLQEMGEEGLVKYSSSIGITLCSP